jgi:putative methanogenesis marker protein 8
MSRHVIEANGKTKVIVEDGRVVKIEEPLRLEYCPIVEDLRDTDKITPDLIRFSIESRINLFGMCTSDRIVSIKSHLVDFGTSEMMMCAIEAGIMDAVVQPCDGAGTVIAHRPEIVQGIGAAMSGLIETSPIPEVISRLRDNGCIVVDPANATIDQERGLRIAFDHGSRCVGVTVAGLDEAKGCRSIESGSKNAVLFGVHTSGMSMEDAKEFMKTIDITTACASKQIREFANNALIQAGTKIPVFAMTEIGKEILLNRIKYMRKKVLIKTCKLPELEDRQPRPVF